MVTKLNSTERNYSVPEREWLSVVYRITTCRPYLFGRSFTSSQTKTASDVWCSLQNHPENSCAGGYASRSTSFRCITKCKPNNKADGLSRFPYSVHTTEHEDTERYFLIFDVTSDKEEEKGKDTHPFMEEAEISLDALVTEPAEKKEVPAQITPQELIQKQASDRCIQNIWTFSKLKRGWYLRRTLKQACRNASWQATKADTP